MLAASGACQCAKKGSSGGGENLVSQQGIPQAPSRLDFGNVAVGQSVQLPLVLGNSGSATLNITSQTVSGPPFSEPTPLAMASIPAGASSHAVLSFTPTQAGPATGTLTLGGDGDPATVQVALAGQGLDLTIAVVPALLNFGQVPVGESPAPTKTMSLENLTTTPFYVTLTTGSTAPEYTVTDAQGQPVPSAPIELEPNVPYVVTVAFAPDKVAVFNSSFSFTLCEDQTTGSCIAPQAVVLNGQGVQAQLALSPSPIAFGDVPDGTSSNQLITVSNVGNAAATVSCLYLESLGPSACGQASASFSLGAVVFPVQLPAGGSFIVPLTYHASGSNAQTDLVEATYTTQGLKSPVLTDSDSIVANQSPSPCSLSLSPSSLSFTYPGAGTPVSQSVTLTNGGGTACQITGIAIAPTSDPSYSLAAGQAVAASVAAGGSATIGVTFDLAAAGPPNTRRGTLAFQSTDPSQANVQVPLLATLQTPYAGGGAWPRWHHDNIQSGLSPNDTSGLQGNVAWTVSVGAPPPAGTYYGYYLPIYDYMNSPVVAADGTVYQLGMDGTLNAVSPDGGLQWATPLEGTVWDPHPGTPIVTADGTVFVAFGDLGPDGAFHVASDGGIIEAIPPAASTDGFDLPPMLTNGGLLLGSDDGFGAFGFQINANGSFQVAVEQAMGYSKYQGGDQISAVVGPDDSTYWCGGEICTALSPPGAGFAIEWGPVDAANGNSAASDLALDESFTGDLMILVGGWKYDTGGPGTGSQSLVAMEPQTGTVVWTATLPPPAAAQQEPVYFGIGDATVGNSCPAIGSDGTVYVGNFDGLHAFTFAGTGASVTGTEKNGTNGSPPFFPTGADDILTAPAIGGDGTIFFGTASGKFYAVNPDGSLRFQLTAGGRIAGSPAIGPSGAVYFTADDGYLYAVN